MDEISLNLSPDNYINPHRSVLGLGNYDVNVLMAALQSKQMNLEWFDKRKEITLENLDSSNTFGYILNIPSDYTFGFVTLPIKSRHWISIKRLKDEKFYNLDSKLDKPKCLGNDEEFIKYLQNEMKSNDKELFLVYQAKDEKTIS
jgi:josephin